MQKGFYITLALFPISYFAYITATSEGNPIERFVDQYVLKSDLETEKHALRARALQQAVADRHLFKNSQVDFNGPEIRYPE
jgi:hypothetical protein